VLIYDVNERAYRLELLTASYSPCLMLVVLTDLVERGFLSIFILLS
jgi:hypothetical protein